MDNGTQKKESFPCEVNKSGTEDKLPLIMEINELYPEWKSHLEHIFIPPKDIIGKYV